MNVKYNYKEIKIILLDICNKIGFIPTQIQIQKINELPSSQKLREIFKKNGYKKGYIQFCKENGYEVNKDKIKSKFINTTYEELCNIWDEYYKIHGFYPGSNECKKKNDLPTFDNVKRICGDKWYEFRVKYKMKILPDKNLYKMYCNLFVEESNKLGRTIRQKELDSNGIYNYILPSSRWFIKNCPDNNVKDYNSFLEYLEFKPLYKISKKMAIELIYKKRKELNRNLTSFDFTKHDKNNELGRQTIINYWGTFNNMLKDLGLPLNIESKIDEQKDIDELKLDIIKLCNYIKDTEERIYIKRDDINNCDWCFHSCVYDRRFTSQINMTLGEFIESIGFHSNKCGFGVNFKYKDGERISSKYEAIISNYLREIGLIYNKDYKKDVMYKTFIPNYNRRHIIDYIIFNKWYIEVAGYLDYTRDNTYNKSAIKYKENLDLKENLLKENNLNYKIIYPHEIKFIPLEELFSFLFIDIKQSNLIYKVGDPI